MKTLGKPALWKSIVFSLIGALIGFGIFNLFYYFNIIAGFALLFMGALSYIGYKLGGADRKHALVTILVQVIVLSLIGFYTGTYFSILAAGGSGIGFFQWPSILFAIEDGASLFLRDFGIFFVFLAITIAFIIFGIIKENKMEKQKQLKLENAQNVQNDVDALVKEIKENKEEIVEVDAKADVETKPAVKKTVKKTKEIK